MAKQDVYMVSEDDYHDHEDSNDGICYECGDWTSGGVEPDARNYKCSSCGAMAVHGAMEALIEGKVDFEEE